MLKEFFKLSYPVFMGLSIALVGLMRLEIYSLLRTSTEKINRKRK